MPGPKRDPSSPYSRAHRGQGRRGVVVLPVECTLPPPKLPAGRDWSREQRRLWRELWSSPQAVMWDDSYALAVAAYVVHSTAVLSGTVSAWQAQEQRHLGNELGLTARGLLALGWQLPDPQHTAPVVALPGGRV